MTIKDLPIPGRGKMFDLLGRQHDVFVLPQRRYRTNPFVQFSMGNAAANKEWQCLCENPALVAAFVGLTILADYENCVYCAPTRLSKFLGVSHPAASTSIRRLEERGFLIRIKDGRGTTCFLNPSLVTRCGMSETNRLIKLYEQLLSGDADLEEYQLGIDNRKRK